MSKVYKEPTSNKKGLDLLYDTRFNRGTLFNENERKKAGLLGLLPHELETLENQVKRELHNLNAHQKSVAKYNYLMGLLDRNEFLFYKFITQYVRDILPLIYTPTVGQICENYSHMFSQPRGLYISVKDKEHIGEILKNWHTKDVKVIVFSDGEKILGLGDIGINCMPLLVGKAQLYVAAAKIPFWQVLPVVLDCGTENEDLLQDKYYLGLKERRVKGREYFDFLEDFMAGANKEFGASVVLQLEDFVGTSSYRTLLNANTRYFAFNETLQGTAAAALAGIIASLKAKEGQGRMMNHTFIITGSSETTLILGSLIAHVISKESGKKEEEARKHIWFWDSEGLVTAARAEVEDDMSVYKKDWAHDASGFAEKASTSFIQAIKDIKPTGLIGYSGKAGFFDKEILETMHLISRRPLFITLNKSANHVECKAAMAYAHTNGKALYASGAHFSSLDVGGKTLSPSQISNVYIFPGLVLGAISAQCTSLPNELLYAAAEAVAEMVSQGDLARGSLYPPLDDIHSIATQVAQAVVSEAFNLKKVAKARKTKKIDKLVASYQYEFET